MTGTSASVVVRISKDVAIAGWVQIQSRSGDLQTRRASAAVALWALRGTCHPERSERISEHFWSPTAPKWLEMFLPPLRDQHDRTRTLRTAKRLQKFRQRLHYQLVGVVDHFPDLSVRNHPVEHDGVPMLFVHVIAGLNLFVAIP